MKNLMKKSKKGFTLMEMLIVVAIIAILVVIAIPTFTNALDNARASTDLANARAWYAEMIVEAMSDDETALPDEVVAGTYTDDAPWGPLQSNSTTIVITEGTDLDDFTVSVSNNSAEIDQIFGG